MSSTMHPRPAGAPGGASGRPKRPTWHWAVLGGCGVMVLLVSLVVAAVLFFQIANRGNPQDTLDDFYTAMDDSDCTLFMETTTEEYREATGLVDCSTFEGMTSQMGTIDYTVDERINRQGYAIFGVTETYQDGGQDVEAPLRFYVRRFDGGWYVDGVEVAGEPTVG